MTSSNYEVFLPVIFIISFMLLLFLVYAINNLDLKSKLFNLYSVCSCWRKLHLKHSKKKQLTTLNQQQRLPSLNPNHNQIHYYDHYNPYNNNNGTINTANYYEGPTDGFYHLGNKQLNYFSHNLANHIHPPPSISTNFRINQIYKSSEDSESFQLTTTKLNASNSPPIADSSRSHSSSKPMPRSYSSNLGPHFYHQAHGLYYVQ